MKKTFSKNWLKWLLVTASIATFLNASAQVPPQLVPPVGNCEAFRLYAIGVQTYVSTENPNLPGTFVWTFVAPEALLANNGGHVKVHHFAGPTWQALNNGSLVKATKVAGVTVDPTSIPWLLLKGVAWAGHGMMSDVSYIQRLDTTNGLAPSWTPTSAGIEVDVPYTATYVFFEAN